MERGFHLEPKTWKLIGLAALAAAAAIGFWPYIAPAVRLIAGGGIIAFLFAPFCDRLALHMKRSLAAAVALLSVLIALVGVLLFTAPYMARQASALMEAIPGSVSAIRTLAEQALQWLEKKGISLMPQAAGIDWNAFASTLSRVLGGMAGFFSSAVNAISSFGMMVVMAYFFLCDKDRLLLRLELLVPSDNRKLAIRMAGAVKRELLLYLRGQALIALMVGALSAVGLLLAGVPSAPLLGALIGVLNMIPYFGPILGGIPAVILAFGGGLRRVLFAVIALVVVQQIDSAVISPRVMGDLTGLNPAAVLLAITLGSSFAGIAGMLFALPILLILRISLRVWAQRREKN